MTSPAVQQSDISSTLPTILPEDVLNAIDGFVFIITSQGIVEYVSDNVTEILNYSPDELRGTSLYNFLAIDSHLSLSNCLYTFTSNSSDRQPDRPYMFNCRMSVKPPPVAVLDNSNNRIGSPRNDHNNLKYANLNISVHVQQSPSEHSQSSNSPFSPPSSLTTLEGVLGQQSDSLKSPIIPTTKFGQKQSPKLVCVAKSRRSSQAAAHLLSYLGMQQFQMRLDLSGVILDYDSSGIHSPDYRLSNCIGSNIREFCIEPDRYLIDDLILSASDKGTIWKLCRFTFSESTCAYVETEFSLTRDAANQPQFIQAVSTILREDNSDSKGSAAPGRMKAPVSSQQHPSPYAYSQPSGSAVYTLPVTPTLQPNGNSKDQGPPPNIVYSQHQMQPVMQTCSSTPAMYGGNEISQPPHQLDRRLSSGPVNSGYYGSYETGSVPPHLANDGRSSAAAVVSPYQQYSSQSFSRPYNRYQHMLGGDLMAGSYVPMSVGEQQSLPGSVYNSAQQQQQQQQHIFAQQQPRLSGQNYSTPYVGPTSMPMQTQLHHMQQPPHPQHVMQDANFNFMPQVRPSSHLQNLPYNGDQHSVGIQPVRSVQSADMLEQLLGDSNTPVVNSSTVCVSSSMLMRMPSTDINPQVGDQQQQKQSPDNANLQLLQGRNIPVGTAQHIGSKRPVSSLSPGDAGGPNKRRATVESSTVTPFSSDNSGLPQSDSSVIAPNTTGEDPSTIFNWLESVPAPSAMPTKVNETALDSQQPFNSELMPLEQPNSYEPDYQRQQQQHQMQSPSKPAERPPPVAVVSPSSNQSAPHASPMIIPGTGMGPGGDYVPYHNSMAMDQNRQLWTMSRSPALMNSQGYIPTSRCNWNGNSTPIGGGERPGHDFVRQRLAGHCNNRQQQLQQMHHQTSVGGHHQRPSQFQDNQPKRLDINQQQLQDLSGSQNPFTPDSTFSDSVTGSVTRGGAVSENSPRQSAVIQPMTSTPRLSNNRSQPQQQQQQQHQHLYSNQPTMSTSAATAMVRPSNMHRPGLNHHMERSSFEGNHSAQFHSSALSQLLQDPFPPTPLSGNSTSVPSTPQPNLTLNRSSGFLPDVATTHAPNAQGVVSRNIDPSILEELLRD